MINLSDIRDTFVLRALFAEFDVIWLKRTVFPLTSQLFFAKKYSALRRALIELKNKIVVPLQFNCI